MNTTNQKLYLALVLLALEFACRHAGAATFAITPTAISNTWVGNITLQIGGLTNSETVFVDHFVDLNGNGIIDSNDWFASHYVLTDGQLAMIGGITNLNVPGDLNSATSAITANLGDFHFGPQWLIGTHLLRLTSPTARFAAITNTFVITNFPYSQIITGAMQCSATNVPDTIVAFVLLGHTVGATVADNSGYFRFAGPPGTYSLVVLKKGYLAHGSPAVALATNQTVATNITLFGVSQILGGRVVDAANTNLGLPGLFLLLNSAGGNLTGGTTDTNGNFAATVNSDLWAISLQDSSGLPRLGYVTWAGGTSYTADTTTNVVVTNAIIPIPQGQAMYYGRIVNSLGAPMPGVEIAGSDENNYYTSAGWSDTNGTFTMVTTTNNWNIFIDNSDPVVLNYVVSAGTSMDLSSNEAAQYNFLAEPATGVITGHVSGISGAPISNLGIGASSYVGNYRFLQGIITDVNGNYSFGVFNGNWDVQPGCDPNSDDSLPVRGYNCVADQWVNVTSGKGSANFTAYPLGTPVFSSPVWLGPGQFGFTLGGTNGGNYYVEVSTDLVHWNTITNFILSGSSIYIEDDNATNNPAFYRTVKQ